jgi:hypothetical protein
MKGILRTLLIIVVIIVVVAVGGYFVLPAKASRAQSFTVDRPPASVFAYIRSIPAGTAIATGVTQNAVTNAADNVVVADVAFTDGSTGTATYTIRPEGDGSRVELRIEQALSGANPLNRLQAITGGQVGPLVEAAATEITGDLNTLPATNFSGLEYSVVQLQAQPFFYIQNCSPSEPDSITSIITQAVAVIPSLMRANRIEPIGPLMAVEPRVVQGQYCYQVGYPYRGPTPRVLLTGATGQTPGGTALRMVYTGSEQNVVAEVYNRMDALLAAAHLDDPTKSDDDWTTYEVYHDDATQAGGSRNREIFYVAQGDITALTTIAPPSASPAAVPTATPPPVAPAAVAPAPAPAPAATTPPAAPPATTPPAKQ